MPGRKQPPEYFEARRALNRHLHRHHGTTGSGMLADRLDIHEQLHIVAKRIGHDVGHTHEICAEGETDIEIAWRSLQDGEKQCGPGEVGPSISIAMDATSQERRFNRRARKHGQADAASD